MIGKKYEKPTLKSLELKDLEVNKLVKIERKLLEVFQSALLQLSNALNKENEPDIEKFSKYLLSIIENIKQIYDMELNREPNKKSILSKKALFLNMYDALKEKEYIKIETLNKKIKRL